MPIPPGEPHRPREITAVHEAGHAVAVHVVGRPFTLVTIVPDGRSWGRCDYPAWHMQYRGPRREDPRNHKTIVTQLAGDIAERRRFPDTDPRYALSDMTKAQDLIGFMLGNSTQDEEDELLADIRAEAEALVAEHWPAIAALADALLARDTLTGDEARAIITACPTQDRTRP